MEESREGSAEGDKQTIFTEQSSNVTTTKPPCPESDVDKECPQDFFMLPGNICKMCLRECLRLIDVTVKF